MLLRNVKFILSAPNKNSWPKNDLKEVCIIGKSNVGKSTFINTLCNNKKLARVSSTPGRTRLLNFFMVDESFYLVDTPGYGYAKGNDKYDKHFAEMMEEYIFERKNVVLYILLVDSRHKPTEDDIFIANVLNEHNKPYILVATKADKLNQSLRAKLKVNIKHAYGFNTDYHLVSYKDLDSFKILGKKIYQVIKK